MVRLKKSLCFISSMIKIHLCVVKEYLFNLKNTRYIHAMILPVGEEQNNLD